MRKFDSKSMNLHKAEDKVYSNSFLKILMIPHIRDLRLKNIK